ncbi:DegV family protein [Marinicrinis sediminis]|uniref:DegV family protein n=1 Tax=Marinicrinis sediminis TaxID=1652465 RepID=A0ABW5R5E1_9BACL
MSVRIVTDSTADVPKKVREELSIQMVPLKVHFSEETYLDAVTIQSEEFYEKLIQAAKLPTTSQPSPIDFMETYKAILAESEETQIVSIHLSSAFSGTYQSAVLARNMMDELADRITIIDSKSASYGFGILVVAAAKAAEKGMQKDELIQFVEEMRQNRHLYFMVDTLDYLQKGGRIGKAAAVFGSLLNIKPILSIDEEGEVCSVDKVRGQKKAIGRIMEMIKQDLGSDEEISVFLAVTNEMANAEAIEKQFQANFKVHAISYTHIGPVIGTHVGPGTVGIFVVPCRYAEYL